jgi:monofunctional biosynthetic peptidoglycan transglycosylase
MQTVKNLFLWPGRSYLRKVIEAGMALVAGAIWGKARTLELYLNVIEWGEGIYGIDAASWHYYGRDLATISPAESAALAAILPSPRKLSPTRLSGSAKRRYQRIVRESAAVRLPS